MMVTVKYSPEEESDAYEGESDVETMTFPWVVTPLETSVTFILLNSK